MISTNYSSTYTHYDFVTIIDQYQGDIKLIKLYLEKKEVNLMNILTGIFLILFKVKLKIC